MNDHMREQDRTDWGFLLLSLLIRKEKGESLGKFCNRRSHLGVPLRGEKPRNLIENWRVKARIRRGFLFLCRECEWEWSERRHGGFAGYALLKTVTTPFVTSFQRHLTTWAFLFFLPLWDQSVKGNFQIPQFVFNAQSLILPNTILQFSV